MKKQINLDALNEHMFEAIEMLKNNSDPEASPNEKIDVDTAKTIADLGKVVVEGFKVKAQVLNMMSRCDNPNATKDLTNQSGILELGE
jgi:hypothetical protein